MMREKMSAIATPDYNHPKTLRNEFALPPSLTELSLQKHRDKLLDE
jgi:hypothetical protein